MGDKLKFVKKFTLDGEIDCNFARRFVKLLPKIKSLCYMGFDEFDCWLDEGSVATIKDMKYLEHVFLHGVKEKISDYSAKKQIFPKSIKSVKSLYFFGSINTEHESTIYYAIDASCINLYSLSIISNRMLEKLACGMPKLQEVKIENKHTLDTSKLLLFLEANPQLRKLSIQFYCCKEEILKTILSCKYLGCLIISSDYWEEIDINNLPSTYSIKYLEICGTLPTPLAIHLINSCNSLDTLVLLSISDLKYLDFSKFKRRINILKLFINSLSPSIISEIDNSNLFNQVHCSSNYSSEQFIEQYNIDKLKYYKLFQTVSKSYVHKLINKNR